MKLLIQRKPKGFTFRQKVSENVDLLLLNGSFNRFQTPTETSQQLPTMPTRPLPTV